MCCCAGVLQAQDKRGGGTGDSAVLSSNVAAVELKRLEAPIVVDSCSNAL